MLRIRTTTRARTRRSSGLGFLAAVVLSACSDVLPPDGSGGDFTINVTTGGRPTYSWSGGSARELRVFDRDDNVLVPVWAVASTNPTASNIMSPFQHGTVPAQTTELSNEQRTLTVGGRYRVEITLLNQQRATRDFRRGHRCPVSCVSSRALAQTLCAIPKRFNSELE